MHASRGGGATGATSSSTAAIELRKLAVVASKIAMPPAPSKADHLRKRDHLKNLVITTTDMFSNHATPRPPNFIGTSLSVICLICVSLYAVVWVTDWRTKPFTEKSQVKWSSAEGPYSFPVKCLAASGCQGWLSGCTSLGGSTDAGKCLTWESGETKKLEMCYGGGVTAGLFLQWPRAEDGMGVISFIWMDATQVVMPMTQHVDPCRLSAALVRTTNHTIKPSQGQELLREWFLTYFSAEVSLPQGFACSSDQMTARAQVVMSPEFYEREVFTAVFFIPFVGDVGGTYGILQSGILVMYVFLLAAWANVVKPAYHHFRSAQSTPSQEAAPEAPELVNL